MPRSSSVRSHGSRPGRSISFSSTTCAIPGNPWRSSRPDWAQELAGSWPQFFLKYLLADERVTAVIPGTSNPAHMADNLAAMRGRLPDADERNRMLALLQTL
jgi:hypothetical protein